MDKTVLAIFYQKSSLPVKATERRQEWQSCSPIKSTPVLPDRALSLIRLGSCPDDRNRVRLPIGEWFRGAIACEGRPVALGAEAMDLDKCDSYLLPKKLATAEKPRATSGMAELLTNQKHSGFPGEYLEPHPVGAWP